jgi:hypothetical protein
MTPIRHKRGNWFIWIPAKMSDDGKRQARYFPSKNAAYEESMRLKDAWRKHGSATFSADERHYLAIARQELGGDLSKLQQVLAFWHSHGPDAVVKTTLADAITKFLDYRATQDLDRRTLRDSKSAMHVFAFNRDWHNLHEITTAEIRAYLDEKNAASTKRTAYKHLKLLFDWAKGERLIAVNPMDTIKAPVTRAKEAEVYRAEDFERVLRLADAQYRDLVPFLALSGFGMMRTGELVSPYADKPVLKWEHVLWSEDKVYVPADVGKQTRRAVGNKREFPLCDAMRHWLEPHRKTSGRIVDINESAFRDRMSALFAAAGVAKPDNGLRKSAISHYIAAHPETGVVLTARYAGNSESIARTHYLAWLSQEAGERWFAIRRA